MKINDFPHTNNLLLTAESLIKQGFSVIPVYGNKNKRNPKKPVTSWKHLQKRLPHLHEIKDWFSYDISAIGIVCGQVSELMVIDFDEHYAMYQFKKHFPQLSETLTVKTRRGYHFYFKIHQKVLSYKFNGGDIKAEKSYVIAPPSQIEDFTYQTINEHPLIHLTPHDVDQLLTYFQVETYNNQIKHSSVLRAGKSQQINLIDIYNSICSQTGRNNALYRTASIARDNGLTIDYVEDTLSYHHVTKPAEWHHQSETPQERFTEAIRTIRSAFQSSSTAFRTTGIPNTLRENLLQKQNSTITPRLLDLFSLLGWKQDRRFTMTEAIRYAQMYGINRKSVMRFLTGDLSLIDGQHIISREYVEYPDIKGLKSLGRGRPIEVIYKIPSTSYLLKLLDVDWSPSDLITVRDIQTAHHYRLALHREYIKRVHPEVPLGYLAKRIGVNVRTLQRYNLELNVQKTQNFSYFLLSRDNLDTLPKKSHKISKNATNGFWLETDDGARFPAWRHVGSQLLKTMKSKVTVCVQRPAKLSLQKPTNGKNTIVWQLIEPAQFVKLQAFRLYENGQPKLACVVDNLFQYVKKRVNRVRYYNLQLHFDSVTSYIAKDDVAETIMSYLFAHNEHGEQVRRPARRGIAYRMLKEFGDGNVYLALRDSHTEMFYSLARHAVNFGHLPTAMKFLLSALD